MMVFHPLSSLAETDLSRSEAGLGASGSNWPGEQTDNCCHRFTDM